MKISTTRASRSPRPRWPPSKSNPPTSTASGTTPLLQGSRTDSAVIRAQALTSQRLPGTVLLHDVQSHVPQHRKIVRGVAQARSVLILIHHHVEPPVQPILHPPVLAGNFVEALPG